MPSIPIKSILGAAKAIINRPALVRTTGKAAKPSITFTEVGESVSIDWGKITKHLHSKSK